MSATEGGTCPSKKTDKPAHLDQDGASNHDRAEPIRDISLDLTYYLQMSTTLDASAQVLQKIVQTGPFPLRVLRGFDHRLTSAVSGGDDAVRACICSTRETENVGPWSSGGGPRGLLPALVTRDSGRLPREKQELRFSSGGGSLDGEGTACPRRLTAVVPAVLSLKEDKRDSSHPCHFGCV